jgi:adenylate cyclase
MAKAWLGQAKKIHRLGFGLAAGVTIIMLALSWMPTVVSRLETLSLDLRFQLRGERPPGRHVVLVAIDEASLHAIGRWPWSRRVQAELVDKIRSDGPTVIGLDLIYSEPEITPYARDLEEIRTALKEYDGAFPRLQVLVADKLMQAEGDLRLAKSLAAAGNVILGFPLEVAPASATSTSNMGGPAGPFRSPTYFMTVKNVGSTEGLQPYVARAVNPPLGTLAEKAMGLGHVFSVPDWDGGTRYEYLAIRYQGQYYPAFSLEIARAHLGVPLERMILQLGEGVELGRRFIPTDQKGRMVINYLGRERSFQYVSAADVLQNRVPLGTFRNRAVIVGATALGTYDQKITPFSNNFPGFEKNATVVESILEEQFLRKTLWSGPLDTMIILIFGLGAGYLLPRQSALPASLLALTTLVGYAAFAQYVFTSSGMWIDDVMPLVTIALTFVVILVMRFMTEERQSREIRAMFSSYVSPQIVEELIRDPASGTKVGGQRKELTMLFADIVDFTQLSEQSPAEEVVAQLNEYLTAMTEVIFRWNGTLDKFVGDGIVAYWGAPLEQPDHVELAVKCALHMRKRLEELQQKWRSEGKISFSCGIGINTGEALVGNVGAQGKKMDYTVIGDHVNLAARVEALTRTTGSSIMVTEYTANRLKQLISSPDPEDNRGHLGHVALRMLGSVKVKGKGQAVVVYCLESLTFAEPSRVDEQVSVSGLEPIS